MGQNHPSMMAARVCCSLLALAAGSSATAPMPPGFGWGTLPTHWFSANVSSQISAEAAERIAARHSLVIFNGQSHAYKAAPFGKGSEGKMIEGGRMIRAAAGRLGTLPLQASSPQFLLGSTTYTFSSSVFICTTILVHE